MSFDAASEKWRTSSSDRLFLLRPEVRERDGPKDQEELPHRRNRPDQEVPYQGQGRRSPTSDPPAEFHPTVLMRLAHEPPPSRLL